MKGQQKMPEHRGTQASDLGPSPSAGSHEKLDPLYVIFEQHLMNFQDPDMDRKTLILKIVGEYIKYLRLKKVHIPRGLESPIVEELATQVNTMLTKKIYGCLNVQDYQRGVAPKAKRRSRARYQRLLEG